MQIQDSAIPPPNMRIYPGKGVPNAMSTMPIGHADLNQKQPFYSDIVSAVKDTHPKGATQASKEEDKGSFSLWDKDGFSVGDILDIFNPLQHLPIVSAIYRAHSGDDIGVAPRILGGALFGGIGGAVFGVISGVVSSLINAISDVSTGKDIGEHVYAMLFGDPDAPGASTVTAEVSSPGHSPPGRQVAMVPAYVNAQVQPPKKTQFDNRQIQQPVGTPRDFRAGTVPMFAMDQYEQMARTDEIRRKQIYFRPLSTFSVMTELFPEDDEATEIED